MNKNKGRPSENGFLFEGKNQDFSEQKGKSAANAWIFDHFLTL